MLAVGIKRFSARSASSCQQKTTECKRNANRTQGSGDEDRFTTRVSESKTADGPADDEAAAEARWVTSSGVETTARSASPRAGHVVDDDGAGLLRGRNGREFSAGLCPAGPINPPPTINPSCFFFSRGVLSCEDCCDLGVCRSSAASSGSWYRVPTPYCVRRGEAAM